MSSDEKQFNNARVSVIAFVVRGGKLLVGAKTENGKITHVLPVCSDARCGESFITIVLRAASECAGVECDASTAPLVWAEQAFIFGERDVAVCVACYPTAMHADFEGGERDDVVWGWCDAVGAIRSTRPTSRTCYTSLARATAGSCTARSCTATPTSSASLR